MKKMFLSVPVIGLAFFHALYLHAQTLDEQFPTVNGVVKTIRIHGNTMYIGGEFTSVGGEPRKNIAAIDLQAKSVTPWDVKPDADVVEIEVHNGKVYFCGHFTEVNLIERNALAVADSATGNIELLNPNIVFPGLPGMQTGTVSSIEIIDNNLYFAGYFISVNGQTRKNVAAVDLSSGNLTPFQINPDIPVNLIRIVGDTLYLGGPFYHVNGVARKGFAAVDRIDGDLLPWAPMSGSPGNTIYSIVPDGDSIIIAGFILNLNNLNHCYLAKTDLAGISSNWKPFSCADPTPSAMAVVVSGAQLVIGGRFSNFNGMSRKNLVMVHKHTGAVDSWNPGPDDWVYSLSGNDSLIAVGGQFDVISGVNRPNFAVYSKNSTPTNVTAPRIPAVKLSGYPNPARSTFTITLTQNAVKNVGIYTTDGKTVNAPYRIEGNSLILDTSQLQTGEYIVQFEMADGKRYHALFSRLSD